MAEIDMARPIVINALNPFYGRYLSGTLGEDLHAYYCYDEIAQAPWTARHGPHDEAAFLPQVDLVITTSEALRRTRTEAHPHTFLVRNGVDYELFQQGRRKRGFQPSAGTPKCVGYVGSLDGRVDYDLLSSLIHSCPEYLFRFVGRVVDEDAASGLAALPNVEILGPRPVGELPALMVPMDVCIIPFVCDEFTRSIYPLKINEYLAAAKPVVMTPFAELTEFNGLVDVASTFPAFAQALRRVVSLDSEDARQARQTRAKANSWQHRATELGAILAAHLPDRPT